MATAVKLAQDAQLKAGDRVLLKFNTRLGEDASRVIAAFVSRFNQEKPLQLDQFELIGNPLYDPVAGTINVYVRVTGTPLVAIIIVIVRLAAGLGLVWILKEAFLVFVGNTAEAVKSVGTGLEEVGKGLGSGLEKTGTGLGVGAAFAGLFLGLVALGALQTKGVKIR